MLSMAQQTVLKEMRKALHPPVSQENLAHASGLTLLTYRKAENGGNISYSTAQAILRALNGYLRAAGKPTVERVEDLGLNIV